MIMEKSAMSLLFVALLVLPSISIYSTAEATPVYVSNEKTRAFVEHTSYGGEWFDDFSDKSGIEEMEDLKMSEGVLFPENFSFYDDGESYYQGQDLLNTDNWIEHAFAKAGAFTADNSPPPGGRSQKVIKQFNDNPVIDCIILSKPINLKAGSLDLWVSTSMLNNTKATTTMNLFSFTPNPPSAYSKLIDVGFYGGGFGYGKDGSWTLLSTNISINTWYHVIVDFDCGKEKCNLFLYDDSDVLIGNALDISFAFSGMTPYPKVSRLIFMTEEALGGESISTYWDNIKIINRTISGKVVSKNIDLPAGRSWSTLSNNKEVPGDSWIKLEMLDTNGKPLQNFNFDGNLSEIDISGLNDLGVNAIKLRATITPNGLDLPLLHSWGVEWNTTRSWIDSFQTSMKARRLDGVEISNGQITLLSGYVTGTYESEELEVPMGYYWGDLNVNTTSEIGKHIHLKIVNSRTNTQIPGYTNLTDTNGPDIDISDIDPFVNSYIRIRATITRNAGESPSIHSIGILWNRNKYPIIQGIDVSPVVLRTEKAKVSIIVYDPEQAPANLHVTLEYLAPGSSSWGDNMFSGLEFNSTNGRYETLFNTDTISPVGHYAFRVRILDEMDYEGLKVLSRILEVQNNKPSPPTILLGPENPTTRSDITATIQHPGFDVENPNLKYSYNFFVNGIEEMEYSRTNISISAIPYLPSSYTQKNDIVSCVVRAADGLNYSLNYTTSTVILNTPPELVEDFMDYIVLEEDIPDDTQLNLFKIVNDIDGDNISFSSQGTDNISVEIDDETGMVGFIPLNDFFGDENVTFNASDGVDHNVFNIKAYVRPINDAPGGWIISPLSGSEIEVGEDVTFNVTGYDVDNEEDDLVFTWRMGEEVLWIGSEFTMNWTEDGTKNISSYVSDGKKETYLGSVILNIFKPEPPYDQEEVKRTYNNSNPPVIFEIIGPEDHIENVRNGEMPSIDLEHLTAEAEGNYIMIKLETKGAPLPPNNNDPSTSHSGSWAFYNVFFVKSGWSEKEFDHENPNLLNDEQFSPENGSMLNVNGKFLTLSYGNGNTFGSPTIDGNTILWTLDMDIFADHGIQIEELNLWGSARFIQLENGIKEGSYDTIGYGASTHNVTQKIKNEEGGKFPVLIIPIIILIVICVVIGLLFTIRRKNQNIGEAKNSSVDIIDNKANSSSDLENAEILNSQGITDEPSASQQSDSEELKTIDPQQPDAILTQEPSIIPTPTPVVPQQQQMPQTPTPTPQAPPTTPPAQPPQV